MNIQEINPYIRLAIHSEFLATFCINRRIILDYELLYVEEGKFLLIYNEKNFLCQKGDLILLCPGIPHSFHSLKVNLRQPHIHFDLKYDNHSDKVFISFRDYHELSSSERLMIRENAFPHLTDRPVLKINDKETFLQLFYDIIDGKDNKSLNCKAKMLCLLSAIISENAPGTFTMPSNDPGLASLVKSYIDSNYKQDIQLSDLEKQFGYSKFYLEKLFKQEYGVSVINYRNSKRMSAATELLPVYSVSQTAQMLGFSSIYAFSRAFRAAYGISPTKYVQHRIPKNDTIE